MAFATTTYAYRNTELEARIERNKIPRSAIAARVQIMKQKVSGLTEEQWRDHAATYLCEVTEELRGYGASVDWT